MQISKYFTLAELTVSEMGARKGIPNVPGPGEIENLKRLGAHVLDPLRTYLGPVVCISGYRSPKLNAAVGGSKTSQHMQGLAADILVPGHSVAFVVATIRKLKLPFDQVIDEFGRWTHVSWASRPRGEVLVARKDTNGRTQYTRAR
jgi:zinc D-Ala-D-Ala carboxypeptidase